VYASFGSKGLLAVDFEGRVVWHQSLGTISAYHGTAGSPLLYKDRLILFQDHSGGSGAFVAAFDTRSGRPLWRTARRETVGWGTPIAVQTGDHDEIIVSSQQRVHAYDPDTGRELWTCGGNTYEVIPTPVVGHGLVFCSSGRAGPTLAIRPGGKGDVTSTHVAWQSPRGSPFVPSPLLLGDYLYLVNDMTSIATSLEATTGKVMWQGRLGQAAREGFSASPVAADGKIFFTNDEGETFVVGSGTTFQLLHVNRLNAAVLASPALVDGKWYFRTDGELVAIGKR
jgi:outer membrane protein assembly factor BamB